MRRPVFCIIEFVCATAHNPPNEVKPKINGYTMVNFDDNFVINGIPFDISNNGNAKVMGNFSPRVNMMENKIIYPPTLVIVSNPFMIASSNI